MAETTKVQFDPAALRRARQLELLAGKLAELEKRKQWNETIVEIRTPDGLVIDYRIERRRWERGRPKYADQLETERKLAHLLDGFRLGAGEGP
jgi:hypothetical protein